MLVLLLGFLFFTKSAFNRNYTNTQECFCFQEKGIRVIHWHIMVSLKTPTEEVCSLNQEVATTSPDRITQDIQNHTIHTESRKTYTVTQDIHSHARQTLTCKTCTIRQCYTVTLDIHSHAGPTQSHRMYTVI